MDYTPDTVLKIVDIKSDKESQINEVKILKGGGHQNIVKCKDCFVNQNKEICLELEKCSYTLNDWI